jgi:hypothetical protein
MIRHKLTPNPPRTRMPIDTEDDTRRATGTDDAP